LPTLNEDVRAIREKTSQTLAEYDKTRQKLNPNAGSLSEVWENVCKVQDTNVLVRENLNQIQVLLHTLVENFYTKQSEREKQMQEKLTSGNPEDIASFHALRKDSRNELINDMKVIDMMANTATKMANEHRQCLLSKQFFYHASLVQGLLMFIQATLHQEIRNAGLLQKISAKMEDGIAKYLPQSTGEEF